MRKSLTIAFCGIITALSFVMMFLGGVVWVFVYLMPMLCGLLTYIVVDISNKKYAFVVYACVSVLSMFFIPDKECAITYVAFFGYYPIIRDNINNIKNKAVSVIIKLLIYNSTIILSQYLLVVVFGIPFDNSFGKWGIPLFILVMNFVLLAYEKLYTSMVLLYNKKYRKILVKYLKK